MVSFAKKRINRITKSGDALVIGTLAPSGKINEEKISDGAIEQVNPVAVADDAVKLYDGNILKRIKYNLIIEKGENG